MLIWFSAQQWCSEHGMDSLSLKVLPVVRECLSVHVHCTCLCPGTAIGMPWGESSRLNSKVSAHNVIVAIHFVSIDESTQRKILTLHSSGHSRLVRFYVCDVFPVRCLCVLLCLCLLSLSEWLIMVLSLCCLNTNIHNFLTFYHIPLNIACGCN